MFKAFNFRSKLILALLTVAALTGLTQAYLANLNVSEGFDERIRSRLNSIGNITAKRVESQFKAARGVVRSMSEDLMIQDAMMKLDAAQDKILAASVTPEILTNLNAFYARDYLAKLARDESSNVRPDVFVPSTVGAQYLQYHYVANNLDTVKRIALADALDQSEYSSLHKRYHPSIRTMLQSFDLHDIFLINQDGKVIYSVSKEVDFMSDLSEGPFNESGLARAFREARRQRGTRPIIVEDFSFYQPTLGAPAAFMATPVYSDSVFIGVLAVQLSSELLNETVSNSKNWQAAGLGETGDLFVLGYDGYMRTSTRPFENDVPGFLAASVLNGTPESVAKRMEIFKTPVMLQSSTDQLLDNIVVKDRTGKVLTRAETKTATVEDYLGRDALTVAIPLKIESLDWALIATMPTVETLKPVRNFQRTMGIALVLGTLFSTLLGLYLADYLTRPLQWLSGYIDRVRGGERAQVVGLQRNDEIGELSQKISGLVEDVDQKLASANRYSSSNERWLQRFLPADIVRDITANADQTASNFDSVAKTISNSSFVVARLSGLRSVLAHATPKDGVAEIDKIVQLLDLAAEKNGLEKVSSAGGRYFAVAGLSAPLIDHRQRALNFAKDIHKTIEMVSLEHEGKLQVRVGIASGDAVIGVVGRQRLNFDVWGDPVSEADEYARVAKVGETMTSAGFSKSVNGDDAVVVPAVKSARRK